MKKLYDSLKDVLTAALPVLIDPRVIGRLIEEGGPFPNLQLPVLRGTVLFRELAEQDGIVLEQHVITGLARIVDARGIRLAWGGERAMRALFARMQQKAGRVSPRAERS